MGFKISKPSNYLSPYIKQYWAIENCMLDGASHIQRIVPSGFTEIYFYLGDKPKTFTKEKNISDPSLVSGQLKSYYDIEISGNLSVFSVTLRPQGAMMFFDLPIIELQDRNIPLRYLNIDGIEEVESMLFETGTIDEKKSIVENFLAKQLQRNDNRYAYNRIDDSIGLITQTKGIISIGALSARACLSRKQFERVFKDHIGISPKVFLRIVRFQNAIFQKQTKHTSYLAELAYDCGYYDQSHMINDFKYFSGMSTGKYFQKCAPYSDYFSN